MGREQLQTNHKEARTKTLLKNTVRAGATAAVLSVGTLLPIGVKTAVASEINFNPAKPAMEQARDRSDEVAEFLDDDRTRIALGLATAASTTGVAAAYFAGEKFDDSKKKYLRMSGPALSALSSGSLLYDSYDKISSDIPAALILGTFCLNAAHTIINTYMYETKPENTYPAVATAGLFVAVGVAAFATLSNSV